MQQVKALAAAAAVALCAAPSVHATGIPTVDAAAISQMVQQVVEMQKQYQMLTDQYENMVKQYNQLKDMTSKLEGISSISDLMRYEEKLELFSEYYDKMYATGIDFMSSGAKAVYTMRGYDDLCEGLPESLKEGCKLEYAWEASAEYEFTQSLQKINARTPIVADLIEAIKTWATAKEIADLQARIQAELGMIEIAGVKVELNKKTLEAAINGAKRVQQARERRYFNVSADKDISKAFE